MAAALIGPDHRDIDGGLRRGRPCSQCRRRKIKCDKQSPCEQCKRLGCRCSYDETHTTMKGNGTGKSLDPTERIAQLEAELKAVTSGLSAPTVSSSGDCSCGRQIFNSSFSIHYDPEIHWIDLFTYLRETYFEVLADNESMARQQLRYPLLAENASNDDLLLANYYPPPSDASRLICSFFENVHLFVCILNKNTFLRDLDRYTMGKHPHRNLAEALHFSVFGLAIISLEPEDAFSMFGSAKESLLDKYQKAQELALHRLNFIDSNEPAVFQSILYFLVFLFERGLSRTASTLLTLAVRSAQRMGLHKDPSWFNYSPWICEWRRRLWNQLLLLDQRAISLDGLPSLINFAWDTRLPSNIDDVAWNTSPFMKPSEVPVPALGFTSMAPSLVKRHVLSILCPLRQTIKTRSYSQQLQYIEAGHKELARFFDPMEMEMGQQSYPSFVRACAELDFESLRLIAGQAVVRSGSATSDFLAQHYIDSILVLEQRTSLKNSILNPGWLWSLRSSPPIIPLAIILTHLASEPLNLYSDRAWIEVDAFFDEHPIKNGVMESTSIAALQSLRRTALKTAESSSDQLSAAIRSSNPLCQGLEDPGIDDLSMLPPADPFLDAWARSGFEGPA